MIVLKPCECGCGAPVKKRFAQGHQNRSRSGTCAKGHPWTRENIYCNPINGKRCCRPCHLLNQKERRAREPDIYWRTQVKHRYGMTEELLEEMLRQQCGLCAICGGFFEDSYYRPSIDHDHRTGAVRGLLCRGCNTGIAMLEHSQAILLRAVEYLHGSNN